MTRTLILATLLTLGTAASAFAGCRSHTGPVMSCAEGAIWDTASQSCVPISS